MATILFSGTVSSLAEFKSAEKWWIPLRYELYNVCKLLSCQHFILEDSHGCDHKQTFGESEFSKPQIPREENVVWLSGFTEMENEVTSSAEPPASQARGVWACTLVSPETLGEEKGEACSSPARAGAPCGHFCQALLQMAVFREAAGAQVPLPTAGPVTKRAGSRSSPSILSCEHSRCVFFLVCY